MTLNHGIMVVNSLSLMELRLWNYGSGNGDRLENAHLEVNFSVNTRLCFEHIYIALKLRFLLTRILTGVDRATPSGGQTGDGGVCPIGHYCPEGSPEPLACEPGFYRSVLLEVDTKIF